MLLATSSITVIIPLAVQEAPEQWRRINEEVTERLEIEPGKFFLLRIRASMPPQPTFFSTPMGRV